MAAGRQTEKEGAWDNYMDLWRWEGNPGVGARERGEGKWKYKGSKCDTHIWQYTVMNIFITYHRQVLIELFFKNAPF